MNTSCTNVPLSLDIEQLQPSNTSRSSQSRLQLLDGTFFEYLPEESTSQNIVALCKKCLPNIIKIKGSDKCTSNFLTHLKRKHGQDCVEECNTYLRKKKEQKKDQNSKEVIIKDNETIKQEIFDENIEYLNDPMIPNMNISCTNSPSSLNMEQLQSSSISSPSQLRLQLLDGTFFIYLPEESTSQNIAALCKKCLPNIIKIKGSDKCTSNFLTHLKRKHGQDCIEECKSYLRKKKEQKKDQNNKEMIIKDIETITQDTFDKNIEYSIDPMITNINISCTNSPSSLNMEQLQSSSISSPSQLRLQLLDGTFFEYLPEESTSQNIVALCKKCLPNITKVKGYGNCTSNFLTHLKRKHGQDCIEEYKTYLRKKKEQKKEQNSKEVGIKDNETNKQETFNENVEYYIDPIIPDMNISCTSGPTSLNMEQLQSSSISSPSQFRLQLLDGTFFEYLPEESTSQNIVALCKKCLPNITKVKGYGNCTSNFLTHLKRKHGQDCIEEYKTYLRKKKEQKKEQNSKEVAIKNNETNKQETFKENAEYFIDPMIPDMNISCTKDPSSLNIEQDQSSSMSSPSQFRVQLLDSGTFFEHLPEESSSQNIMALCMRRSPKITQVKGNDNCTSNFSSNLKRKHEQDSIEEYKTYSKKMKEQKTDLNSTITVKKEVNTEDETLTQETFDENITKYFIQPMIPNINISCTNDPLSLDMETQSQASNMSSPSQLRERNHEQDCIKEYKTYSKKMNEQKTDLNSTKTVKKEVNTEDETLTQETFDENIVEYFIQPTIPEMNISYTDDPLSLDMESQSQAISISRPSQVGLQLLDGTFFEYLPEESTSQNIMALCMKCLPKMTKVKGYGNCTSNFLSHLKRKHGQDCIEEYKAYLKKKREQKTDQNSIKIIRKEAIKENETLTQKIFEENIVEYFIHSMIPLEAVEDPYFLRIFSNLGKPVIGLKFINRRRLQRYIEDYYQKQITKIKSELQSVDYVCTIIDIWPRKKTSFIGITAHWITEHLKRMSVALVCQIFTDIPSYDRITDIIQKINTDFGLNIKKLVASVIVNDSCFVEAFRTLGVQLINNENSISLQSYSESCFQEIEEQLTLGKEIDTEVHCLLSAHVRCCVHTLSLCAIIDANKILNAENTALSNIHTTVMKKCNDLWNVTVQPKTAELIQDILHHTLSPPDETRWNSLFDALQQISSIKEKSLQLHKALNIQNSIQDNEFDYIKEYLMCTAPVTEALDIMQSENNTYYGIVLPWLLVLRKKLQKIERKNNFTYCAPLIETYRQSVETRFKNFFDLNTTESENAAIAALSYPRFKNKWLTYLNPDEQNKVIEVFNTLISKEINDEPQKTSPTKTIKKEKTLLIFDSDSNSSSSSTPAKSYNSDVSLPPTKAELLMLQFFAEDSEELGVLNRYPEIKSIFIKYNTPLPASTVVERLFSHATMANLPKSHMLLNQMFDKKVVLKYNLNYSKK